MVDALDIPPFLRRPDIAMPELLARFAARAGERVKPVPWKMPDASVYVERAAREAERAAHAAARRALENARAARKRARASAASAVLDALEHGADTATAIAVRTEIPLKDVSRGLRTLVRAGKVEKISRKRYRVKG